MTVPTQAEQSSLPPALTESQQLEKEKFLAKPINCKLFVEKINTATESEFRMAEVFMERSTPARGVEFYVHYVEFNKRLDEWVSIQRLDFTRTITFPVVKKKNANNKKGRPLPKESSIPPSTPTPSSSMTDAPPTPTASTSQKRKHTDDLSQDLDTPTDDQAVEFELDDDQPADQDQDNGIILDEDDDMDSQSKKKKVVSKQEEIEQLRTSGSMTQCVSEIARVKNFNMIQMGKHQAETWYFSPYPVEYAYTDVLYLCEFCLSYYGSSRQLERHRLHCQLQHPPGNEIYRDDVLSFFEIDGRKQRTWCRNLCLLSKLFLDHKTLYYDVDPFLFYCMTERDEFGYHLIGYFSKEKESSENYNLACILTLPQYQRMGYGRVLIQFSYELSKVEERTGSPEKPLSDLGLLSYRAYWTETIVELLLTTTEDITIEEISQHTSITTQDILHTLQNIGALRYYRGQHIICLGDKVIEQFERNKQKNRRSILSEKLHWKPTHFTPSQLRYL
ncbi:hypothetical protein DM01DRAFT_1338118 [Hesseltinella vesiculosa]|uniref:histone acetyltransferase n=1 Tax=Hesseltinella vesiculosa TaxID=101127 RepID=A0A1X2GAQ8_9FUNG|nr:hypothetical protein DM01DRAFT_1338118 [Hesseltinella vesiculosa]